MSIVIRLARKGKRHHPYYRIAVADSRVKPTGRFLQHIGNYDPNEEPPVINIDEDSAIEWLNKGARPSETVEALLRHKGIMDKHRQLKEGVSPEEAKAEPKPWKPPKKKPSKKQLAKQESEKQGEAKSEEAPAAT